MLVMQLCPQLHLNIVLSVLWLFVFERKFIVISFSCSLPVLLHFKSVSDLVWHFLYIFASGSFNAVIIIKPDC